VQDSGPGIRPDQLPHLFDAFYTNDAEDLGKQGLGIGLWLTSRMIDLPAAR
jgi:two-component system OmpR family sensor kinase